MANISIREGRQDSQGITTFEIHRGFDPLSPGALGEASLFPGLTQSYQPFFDVAEQSLRSAAETLGDTPLGHYFARKLTELPGAREELVGGSYPVEKVIEAKLATLESEGRVDETFRKVLEGVQREYPAYLSRWRELGAEKWLVGGYRSADFEVPISQVKNSSTASQRQAQLAMYDATERQIINFCAAPNTTESLRTLANSGTLPDSNAVILHELVHHRSRSPVVDELVLIGERLQRCMTGRKVALLGSAVAPLVIIFAPNVIPGVILSLAAYCAQGFLRSRCNSLSKKAEAADSKLKSKNLEEILARVLTDGLPSNAEWDFRPAISETFQVVAGYQIDESHVPTDGEIHIHAPKNLPRGVIASMANAVRQFASQASAAKALHRAFDVTTALLLFEGARENMGLPKREVVTTLVSRPAEQESDEAGRYPVLEALLESEMKCFGVDSKEKEDAALHALLASSRIDRALLQNRVRELVCETLSDVGSPDVRIDSSPPLA